ncbi:hypothetical protein D6764_04310, partial [Candidatus Woesearchaeota archaeon]
MFALTITPASASIPNPKPGEEYDFIVTVINDQPGEVQVELSVDPASFYLAPYTSLSPSSFTLSPDEKINVNVALRIPKDISPEEHILYVVPFSSGQRWSPFEVSFTIPGNQVHNLTLKRVEVPDTTQKEATHIDVELFNHGNVIARAVPHIEILKGDTIIDTVDGKREFLFMPGKDYNLSILYDPANLPLGFYKARVHFTYADWRFTNSLEDGFQVKKYSNLKDFEGTSQVSIMEGESLEVEMAITYASATEYSLEAEVEGTDVTLNQEGFIEAGEQKVVSFEMPTESLKPGKYTLKATIIYGEDFNQKAEKTLTIQVKPKSSALKNAGIGLALVLFAGILIKSFQAARHGREGTARSSTGRRSWRRRRLERKLLKAQERYSRLEREMKDLISSTQKFIGDSNLFLHEKF